MDQALYDLESLILSSYKSQSTKETYTASVAFLQYVYGKVIAVQFLLPRELGKHSSPFEDHRRPATTAAFVHAVVDLCGCHPSQIVYPQMLPSLKGPEYLLYRCCLLSAVDDDGLTAAQICSHFRSTVCNGQFKGLCLKNILDNGEQVATVDADYECGPVEGRGVCDLTADKRRYRACVQVCIKFVNDAVCEFAAYIVNACRVQIQVCCWQRLFSGANQKIILFKQMR